MSSAGVGGSPRSCCGLAVKGDRPRLDGSATGSGDAGDAEVRELHAPARIEQHVAGLEVAVDDAALVGVLERLRDLDQHRHAQRDNPAPRRRLRSPPVASSIGSSRSLPSRSGGNTLRIEA